MNIGYIWMAAIGASICLPSIGSSQETNVVTSSRPTSIVGDMNGLDTTIPHREDDHTDKVGAKATVITIDSDGKGEVFGKMEVSGDADVFQFSIEKAANISIAVKAVYSGFDPAVEILNDAGKVIAQDDNSGQGRDSLANLDVKPGRYFVKVTKTGKANGREYYVSFKSWVATVVTPGRIGPKSNPDDTVTKTLAIKVAKKVTHVFWSIQPDVCTVQIRFPAVPDGEQQPQHPVTNVWLLKADGTSVAYQGKPRTFGTSMAGHTGESAIYSFPSLAKDEAVAVVVSIDGQLFTERLKPFAK